MMKHLIATPLAIIFALASIGASLGVAARSDGARSAAARSAADRRRRATLTNPTLKICLPERFRLLTDQRFDLRIEAAGLLDLNASIRVALDGVDATSLLPAPEISADNDADPTTLDRAWVFRRWSFSRAGVRELRVTITDGARALEASARIGVQSFQLAPDFKNVVLFIGDGMGTAYRDAARIVAKSANDHLREGFYDELLQMDQMPISGMVMTHSFDRLAPDSANTASAWATGNKTVHNALGVLPDNNDHRFNAADVQGTKLFALDNPRIETLWEYLRRRHDYRTGIVTTADVTDATPAACVAHTGERTLYDDVARQYVEGVAMPAPAFDVILGGGRERFTARTRERSGDTRDLVDELRTAGWTYVRTRAELRAEFGDQETSAPETSMAGAHGSSAISSSALMSAPLVRARSVPRRLLGLFRAGAMNVAYDKLGLPRPADEPRPQLDDSGGDQPFLDEMTHAALAVLRRDNMPFILLVEAGSIDKQSHSNHAAGQIWDTIELDRAVGVARRLVAADKRLRSRTLLLVTADHDQSMSLLGTVDTQAAGAVTNVRSTMSYPLVPTPASDERSGSRNGTYGDHGANRGEVGGFPDYKDADGDGYPEASNRFHLGVGYRTTNHTASSVPLTAEGAGALLFTGYFDQTDIFFKIASVLGSDTSALDQSLNQMRVHRTINQNY